MAKDLFADRTNNVNQVQNMSCWEKSLNASILDLILR
jgi:hypothetical protein